MVNNNIHLKDSKLVKKLIKMFENNKLPNYVKKESGFFELVISKGSKKTDYIKIQSLFTGIISSRLELARVLNHKVVVTLSSDKTSFTVSVFESVKTKSLVVVVSS